MTDRPEVPEWLERLRGPCPACGGQGFHVEPDHDPACDGEHCGVLGCPVPVQIQCDCQGLLFSLIAAHPDFVAMREKAEALDAARELTRKHRYHIRNMQGALTLWKALADRWCMRCAMLETRLEAQHQRARQEPTDD